MRAGGGAFFQKGLTPALHVTPRAFAEEIFRVYSLQHPEVRIVHTNAGPEVKWSIKRAKTGGAVLPFNRMDH
jgi:hypothetical protein